MKKLITVVAIILALTMLVHAFSTDFSDGTLSGYIIENVGDSHYGNTAIYDDVLRIYNRPTDEGNDMHNMIGGPWQKYDKDGDNHTFVYTTLKGDFDYYIKVSSLPYSNKNKYHYPHVGLVVREDPNDAFARMHAVVYSTRKTYEGRRTNANGYVYQVYRDYVSTVDGGSLSWEPETDPEKTEWDNFNDWARLQDVAAPLYLRVSKVGASIKSYYGYEEAGKITWKMLGSTEMDWTEDSDKLYVGIGVARGIIGYDTTGDNLDDNDWFEWETTYLDVEIDEIGSVVELLNNSSGTTAPETVSAKSIFPKKYVQNAQFIGNQDSDIEKITITNEAESYSFDVYQVNWVNKNKLEFTIEGTNEFKTGKHKLKVVSIWGESAWSANFTLNASNISPIHDVDFIGTANPFTKVGAQEGTIKLTFSRLMPTGSAPSLELLAADGTTSSLTLSGGTSGWDSSGRYYESAFTLPSGIESGMYSIKFMSNEVTTAAGAVLQSYPITNAILLDTSSEISEKTTAVWGPPVIRVDDAAYSESYLNVEVESDDNEIEVVIMDYSGQIVARLADVESDTGGFRVKWDGTTDDGFKLAPGTYYARVSYKDGSQQIAPVVILY